MELYFCSHCAISIPQSQIESGAAAGPGGKYFCSEHRVATTAPAPAATAVAVVEPNESDEFELLFCSNCRVSIPQSDAKSGRARRLYGSLLCAVCSKADPGERAARREAVESEMTLDAIGQDPVASFSPPSAPKAESRPEKSNTGFVVLVVLVAGAFLVAGVAAAGKFFKPEAPPEKGWVSDVEALERRVQSLDNELAKARGDNATLREDLRAASEESAKGLETRLSARYGDVTTRIEGLAKDAQGASRQLAEKVAHQEGVIAQLSEQVRALTASMGDRRPPEPPPGGGDDTGTGGEGPKPPPPGVGDGGVGDGAAPVRPPDPKVLQYCNELIDASQDDSVRFPAATELGRLGDPSAIPYLAKALVTDKHFLVRRACARSLGNLRAWYAIPHLITALQDKEAYVAQQASYALQTICGQDFGVTQDQTLGERKRRARDAGKWWEKNESSPPEGVALQKADM